ncbi:helix-turn-helix domain-containing protein [Sporomusa sphaeroides]|uniref:helix-turn-helix domain-containing protein n=1 Tax=Sporomusa sphaeroides TaxID=47679 RepID=UPI003DA02723
MLLPPVFDFERTIYIKGSLAILPRGGFPLCPYGHFGLYPSGHHQAGIDFFTGFYWELSNFHTVASTQPPERKGVIVFFFFFFFPSVFSERLTLAMKKRNIGVYHLSRMTGVAPVTVRRWLNGIFEPRQANLFRISAMLDISSDYLIGLAD